MAQARLLIADVGLAVSVGLFTMPTVTGGGVIFDEKELKQGVW